MKNFNVNFRVMIYLIGCVLNKVAPSAGKLKGMDPDELLTISDYHSMSALTAYALKDMLGNRDLFTPEQETKWQTVSKNAFRRNILLSAMRDTLKKYLEANGIWYVMLKGSRMMHFYPSTSLREMADIDLLFDERFAEQVHNHMLAEGFTVDEYQESNHDTYQKPPIYEIEFHKALFGHDRPVFSDYYRNIKEKLVPSEKGSCEYFLTDEDFYLYMAAHACKHLEAGGLGVKTLADTYLFLHSVTLDREYIRRELKKLDIVNEEKLLRELAEKVFREAALDKPPLLTDTQRHLLEFIEDSGNYGTEENMIKSRIRQGEHIDFDNRRASRSEKRKYVRARIFLSKEQVQKWYPYFAEHKGARPFLIFYRIGQALTTKRKKVSDEIKTVSKS